MNIRRINLITCVVLRKKNISLDKNDSNSKIIVLILILNLNFFLLNILQKYY